MTAFETQYYWAVICRNERFHRRQNIFFCHKIRLAETDPFSPPPALPESFTVRCDNCGREYPFSPADLVRFESDPSPLLAIHPLFRDEENHTRS